MHGIQTACPVLAAPELLVLPALPTQTKAWSRRSCTDPDSCPIGQLKKSRSSLARSVKLREAATPRQRGPELERTCPSGTVYMGSLSVKYLAKRGIGRHPVHAI